MTTTAQAETNNETLAAIEAFERKYRYDATYMKDMLEAAPEALAVFQSFLQMVSHPKACPVDLYHVASIAAFQHVDCGPCLQLAARYAVEAGVPRETIEAALNQPETLTEKQASVHTFANSILQGAPDHDALRQKLVNEIGEAAVIEIALKVASAQIFPVVKRALGHYQSCTLVSIEIEA